MYLEAIMSTDWDPQCHCPEAKHFKRVKKRDRGKEKEGGTEFLAVGRLLGKAALVKSLK